MPPSSPVSCAETIRPVSPSPKDYAPVKPTISKQSNMDFGGTNFLLDLNEDSLLADFFQLALRDESDPSDERASHVDDEKYYAMFTKAVTPKPKSPTRLQLSPFFESGDNRGRSSSFSGSISRASEQAPALRAIRIPARQRSDSLPSAPMSPLVEHGVGDDVASSLPSGSLVQERGPNVRVEPQPPSAGVEVVPEVMRLHSLLEKPKPISTPQSRNVKPHQFQDAASTPTRPAFSRSASLHHQRVVPQAKSNLSSSLPTSNNIPSSMAINVPSSYSMSPSMPSPSQLPVQHRFASAGTQQAYLPPRVPAMQQETRVRGERRGSVSTASSAAQSGREVPNARYGGNQQTSPVQPAFVPSSSLGRKPPVVAAAHDFWTPQVSQMSSSISS
ncbi:hypothetical protein SCHPADRAFT_642983 [Schizopora paradoxa]|uniref:Uncharacterized protein n=1 Tax=Schizopora paradoxa TaxID=27342 RepID=A0A0H2R862_9AGAM|nr:hypothetical protein SCHPADRAFT_642983 [Schizopora paradoxa]